MNGRFICCVLLLVPIYLLIWVAITKAEARTIPEPCLELAARHGKPIPNNEREARKARWEVSMLALFGDPLAKQCRRAINAELRK